MHGLPSSHGLLLALWMQPEPAAQLSVVHGLPSSQSSGVAPAQVPLTQTSPAVHRSPSVQETPSAAFVTQPWSAWQAPVVQELPSSQSTAAPPMHVSVSHRSPTVHGLPSLQGAFIVL